ncbi:MAG: LD-carboxypeptidase [Lachnospiraceae bacterium]|nr:LD-carboxypeptidase [Lachnospiraceae bacterium]
MRYPESLKPGGTIGFPAPSYGCAVQPYRAAFMNALKKWQEKGYRTLPGPNCYADAGIGISNTPEKCAQEFMELYCSGNTDCLISCGGGELMCEILPYIDFVRLAQAKPKWFMGYSDNTNLTYLLATLTDTASLYGPCAAAFGMEPWDKSLEDAAAVLTGQARSVGSYGRWEKESLKDEDHPLEPYHLTEELAMKCYVGNTMVTSKLQFQGRLLGGCMDCLVNLTGTRFDKTRQFIERYHQDGIVWFLESCDLNVFAIRRAMWQMEEAGWFDYVKGFLIGRPANGEPMAGLDAYEAVLETAGPKNVPVIMDMDLGHRPPMMPLIVGSTADIVVSGNSLSIGYTFS